jgi:hypothetical protein
MVSDRADRSKCKMITQGTRHFVKGTDALAAFRMWIIFYSLSIKQKR